MVPVVPAAVVEEWENALAYAIGTAAVVPCNCCTRRTESTPSLYFVHWHHSHRNLAEMVVDHSGKQVRTSLVPCTRDRVDLDRQVTSS